MAQRLSTPRIPPIADGAATPRQQEVIDNLIVGPTQNIYKTIARHPDAAAAMVNLGRTLRGGTLSGRHREILILRTGWNCQSAYEFAQHRRLALQYEMTLDEIKRIQDGPEAPGWDAFEQALCRACDEVHRDQIVSDETWAILSSEYDEQEMIEATMLIGYYHLVSFVLNSLGVPLEEGAESFLED
jgi:4-carboxymuconolactone decarboxylase